MLYNLLAKLTVGLLGPTEIGLRLPSVVAGGLLLWPVAVILRRVEHAGLRWATFLLVAGHPLLLDFCVAARGYSLSILLVLVGFVLAERRWAVMAGVALGLGAAANLTAVIPSVGIVVWFGLHSGRWREVARLVGSLGVVVGTLWVLFLASATRANFYVGFDSLWQSARNLALLSVRTNFEQAGLWGTDAAGLALAALATGLVAHLGIQVLYEGWRERRAALGIVVGVALGSMVAARWGAGVLYPTDRTGLWLVVLFLLAWGCGADRERSAGARYVHLGVIALLVAQFVSQWQGRYFIVWAYDEDTKAIARQIVAERGGRPTRVSTSASRQPALEFYRVTLPIAGMAPVERVEKPVLEGYDYYVLGHEDLGRGEVGRMRVVRVDRVKGSLFARGE